MTMQSDTLLSGLRFPALRLVASYWARFALRTGGGLMSLLTILVSGLICAAAVISPTEHLMIQSKDVGFTPEETAAYIDELAGSPEFVTLVEQVTGTDSEEVGYLLQKKPALLSVIFLVLFPLVPFLVCFAAFNQTAGDIGNRGLRYLLLRTERANVFLGRFSGVAIFLFASLALLMAVLLTYVGAKFRIYPTTSLIAWGVQGLIALMLIALPYAALCAWVSSMLDGAFAALALCLLFVGFPIVFLKIADAMLPLDCAWTLRALPWGWKYELLSVHIGKRLVAGAAMLGFSVLFLFLGLLTFKKRDL